MYEQKEELLDKEGRYAEAIDCCNKIIEHYEKTKQRDDTLASAYSRHAWRFASLDVMDKAIEHIDRAIEIETSGLCDEPQYYWDTKLKWISDEEAIKFIDDLIENQVGYDEEDKCSYIIGYMNEKITILKRLGKNEESKKIQKEADKLLKSIKEKEEMEE